MVSSESMRALILLAWTPIVIGCNAIWSLGDLSYGPGGSGGTTSTAHGAGGMGGTGGGAAEQCLDEVDNDGDGLTDCEDALGCAAGYECVPAVTGAAYTLLVQPADDCPPGTEPSTVYACTGCQCIVTSTACHTTLQSFDVAGCPSALHTYDAAAGGCQSGSDAALWVTLTATMQTPPTCAAQAAHAPPGQWQACTLAHAGFCPNGQACVPRAVGPLGTCAVVGDTDVCPSELPLSLLTYADAGLQCNCSCTPGAAQCGAASVTIWNSSPDCSAGSTTQIGAGATCQSAGVIGSLEFNVATATMSCPASAQDVPAGPSTKLCCPG
jgi:hypothetical protein